MRSRSGSILVPVFLFLTFAFLYAIWLPHSYSGDDLQQAAAIAEQSTGIVFYHPEGGRLYEPGLTDVPDPASMQIAVNPRYLLERPTMVGAARLWHALSGQNDVLGPILALRILAGSLGIVFFYLGVQRLWNSVSIALIAATGLGITLTYWVYSTHVDQSITMVAMVCIAFYMLVRYSQTRQLRDKLLVIGFLSVATFYNFTAVFTTAAFALGTAALERQWTGSSLPQLIQRAVGFGLIYAAVVLGAILLAVALLAGPERLADSTYWSGVLFAGKPEYNIALVQDVLRGVLALGKSLVVFPGVSGSLQAFWDSAGTGERVLLLTYYGVVLTFMSLAVLLLYLARRGHGRPVFSWLWVTLGLTFVFHTLFNLFWDPGFIKYWLLPLWAWWLAVAAMLASASSQQKNWVRVLRFGTAAFVTAIFTLNFVFVFLPESRPESNPWVEIAQEVGRETSPNSLFISLSHPLDFHITYFAHRNLLSIGLLTYAGRGAEIDEVLGLQVARHLADDGEVYVISDQHDTLAAIAERLNQISGPIETEAVWSYPHQVTIYRVIFPGT